MLCSKNLELSLSGGSKNRRITLLQWLISTRRTLCVSSATCIRKKRLLIQPGGTESELHFQSRRRAPFMETKELHIVSNTVFFTLDFHAFPGETASIKEEIYCVSLGHFSYISPEILPAIVFKTFIIWRGRLITESIESNNSNSYRSSVDHYKEDSFRCLKRTM